MLRSARHKYLTKSSRSWAGSLAISFAFMASPTLAGAEELKLSLSATASNIRLLIKNISDRSVTVDRRLAIGSHSAPVEVTLEIRDEKNRPLEFLNPQNIRAATEFDWIVLNPNEFLGADMDIAKVGENFGVRLGNYSVKARYEAHRDAAIEGSREIRLLSNAVTIKSDKDFLKEFCDLQLGADARKKLPWMAKYCR